MEKEYQLLKFNKPLENEGEQVLKIVESVKAVVDEENTNWSFEDLKGEMLRSFEEAGRKALEENQGTIFVTLSGGIDSTLGLAMLRKNFPDAKIVAFTMGGSEEHSDVIHARLAAEKFSAEHREIIPNQDDIQEALEEYQKEFPNADIKKAVADGDFDVYLLYKNISKMNPKLLIAYDGIDELTGGYWGHRKGESAEERKKAFAEYWKKLIPNHLRPLLATSKKFDIRLIFPFLNKDLASMISKIPISDRVSDEIGKLPIRELAKAFEIPEEIIKRSKRGQVGMLEIKGWERNSRK
ncbi:MAG: asparagine synthase-related protein [Candidatus Moraniibacteriota bacterium]